MIIEIEKKITIDVEDPEVEVIIAFNETISSGSGDPDTALEMIAVGENQLNHESQKKLVTAVSDYLKSLIEPPIEPV